MTIFFFNTSKFTVEVKNQADISTVVAQIQEDIRNRNNDGHNHQGVDIPQLCVVGVLLTPSIVAGGVPLLHPGSGVVVGLGSHTL